MSKTINYEKVGGTALGFVLAGNLTSAKEKIEFFFKKTGISDKGKFDYFCFLQKELNKAEEEAGKTTNTEMHEYLASQVTSYYNDAIAFVEKSFNEKVEALKSELNEYGQFNN